MSAPATDAPDVRPTTRPTTRPTMCRNAPLRNADLLALAAALPAGQRAGVLDRVDVGALTGWEAEELVRLTATAVAAVTALQVRSRLGLAAAYGRLRAEAQAARDARDAAARAVGERVPRRARVADQSVSGLMKLENISRSAAEGRLAHARNVASRLPRLLALLEAGEVSPDHVRMVRAETDGLSADACRAVEARLLESAATERTPGGCATAARHAAADADPGGFAHRNLRARSERHAYVKPLPDGMAVLGAVGPAERVALAWLEIDEQARGLRASGDPRSLGQLRADLMLGVPHRALGSPPGSPTSAGAAATPMTVGTSTVDLRTGVITTHSWTETDDADVVHAASTSARRGRRFQGRPVATVLLMPVGTFLGASEAPAHIQGVGPIPADIARELAHGSRSWFRAALDSSGVVRDYGRLRAPRQDLRDLIIRGQATVCACGCGQPATQIDHRHEFRHGGATAEENLTGLATRCHAEKTDAISHRTGWTPTLIGDGTVRWTSPFGHERLIRLADLGFTLPPARRIDFDDPGPPPARPYDPTKPLHFIYNPKPATPAPRPTLPEDGSPPF